MQTPFAAALAGLFLLAASTHSRLAMATDPPTSPHALPVAAPAHELRPRLVDRLAFDLTYEVATSRQRTFGDAYARDATTGRESAAAVLVDRRAGIHGLTLSGSFALWPHIGMTLEGSMHEDMRRPDPDPSLDRVGVRLGARRKWGIGVLCEVRPWQSSFGVREGWFFRTGLRRLWVDYRWRRDARVVEPGDRFGDDTMWLSGVGYRLAAGSGLSLSLQGILGVGWEDGLIGVGFGGGIH